MHESSPVASALVFFYSISLLGTRLNALLSVAVLVVSMGGDSGGGGSTRRTP